MLLDVIKKRKSVRTFSPEPLEDAHRIHLESHLESIGEGPFRHVSRIMDAPAADGNDEGQQIGTYGVIKGQQGYLVGICRPSRESLMDLGYNMQGAVLLLSSLGIGTCWLGGTFKRSDIKDYVDLEDDEGIAAVIPYGYPAEKARVIEGLMKKAAGSSKRRAFNELFTVAEEADEGVFECLEAVRLAPSSMNNQPWRAVVDGRGIHLFMALPGRIRVEAGLNMRYLDIGIAMYHLEGVCKESFGCVGWENDERGSQLGGQGTEYVATLKIGKG